MNENEPVNNTDSFEKALANGDTDRYVLKLFIAGNTNRSVQAIENIRDICETRLQGRYTLEVIDISQQPDLARGEQILAVPTLIKLLPGPLRRVIGDLSNTERVLVGLNLKPIKPDEQGQR